MPVVKLLVIGSFCASSLFPLRVCAWKVWISTRQGDSWSGDQTLGVAFALRAWRINVRLNEVFEGVQTGDTAKIEEQELTQARLLLVRLVPSAFAALSFQGALSAR